MKVKFSFILSADMNVPFKNQVLFSSVTELSYFYILYFDGTIFKGFPEKFTKFNGPLVLRMIFILTQF